MFIQNNGEEDTLKEISEIFARDWIVGFNYLATEPTTFYGSALESELARNPFLQKNIFYITCIYEFITYGRFKDTLPPETIKEMDKWERDGGQCIYLSALLHALLIHDKVAADSEITLCQGYYMHECREDNFLGLMMGKTHSGLHAWLEVKGSIIDISIRQEEQFFDFNGMGYIIGRVPDGLSIIGFRETRDTAKGYGRKIARDSGTVYLDWVKDHAQAATRMFLEHRKKTPM